MDRKSGITKTTIKDATDNRSWQRGSNYYDQGRVHSLLTDNNEITAKVSGTRDYKVVLEIGNGNIEADCSCPMGDGGYFCKHCVAVGLAYLDGKGQKANNKKQGNTAKITMEDIRKYLASKSQPELIDMLLEHVQKYDGFRDKLFLLLAANHKGQIAIDTYRDAIDEATSVPDYDYRYNNYYGHDNSCNIYDIVDSIESLLKDGHPEEVMDLAEYSIDRCDSAMEYMDEAGDMYNNIERLTEIYYEACKNAKPDPETFAQKLFTMSLQNSWFQRSITQFSTILGDKGTAIYRKLALEEWKKTPSLKANDKREYSGPRSSITTIMETLAGMDDDIEMLAAIYSKSLTDPHDYLKIAKLYKEHKQNDKALEWAEKAVNVFGDKASLRTIGHFLADEYHCHKRHDQAMKIVWYLFTEHACLGNYQNLKEHANRCKQWKQWRIKALEYIEAEIGKGMRKAQKNGWSFSQFSDHSLLVEIYLWEETPQKAWNEAATGGCSTVLWLKLAKEREIKHPKDSIRIYQSVIGPIVEQTNNDAYREAVRYIKSIKKLAIKMGEKKEFEIYLTQVMIDFKRKRNFIKMLKSI